MEIKTLILILFLSACCAANDNDCAQDELAQKRAEEKANNTPVYVATQDNVKLYKIWTIEPRASDHWTYFTTPCGDVTSQINYRVGKSSRDIRADVPGVGCK